MDIKLYQITVLMFFLTSCNKCYKKYNIEEQSIYFFNKKLAGDSFCEIADLASKGDKKSIIKIINMKCENGTFYDQAEVIISIIKNCSETTFLDVIKSNKENINLSNLNMLITIGFGYNNDPNANDLYKKEFPMIYSYLNNDI